MYYEEKLIDGKLCYRTDILAEWTQYTYADLVSRYMDEQKMRTIAWEKIEAMSAPPPTEGSGDGLVCPRCGRIFHDKDITNNPKEYHTCETCGVISHSKCRGPLTESKHQAETEAVHKGLVEAVNCDGCINRYTEYDMEPCCESIRIKRVDNFQQALKGVEGGG